jgi:hypothetical protein
MASTGHSHEDEEEAVLAEREHEEARRQLAAHHQ